MTDEPKWLPEAPQAGPVALIPEPTKEMMLRALADAEELVLQGQLTALVVTGVGPGGQITKWVAHGPWEAIGMLAMAKRKIGKMLV